MWAADQAFRVWRRCPTAWLGEERTFPVTSSPCSFLDSGAALTLAPVGRAEGHFATSPGQNPSLPPGAPAVAITLLWVLLKIVLFKTPTSPFLSQGWRIGEQIIGKGSRAGEAAWAWGHRLLLWTGLSTTWAKPAALWPSCPVTWWPKTCTWLFGLAGRAEGLVEGTPSRRCSLQLV